MFCHFEGRTEIACVFKTNWPGNFISLKKYIELTQRKIA
jgi:hypothetical protein